MSFISSPNHKRHDTLELTGDQQAADRDQLREHLPEFFDKGLYLNQLQSTLDDLCKFHSSRSLKASLSEDDQKKLDAFTADLNRRIQNAVSKTPFEFDIQHESEDLDEDGFEKEHQVVVALSNIESILKRAEKPILDVDSLHRLSAFIGHLQSQIQRSRTSLPNFEEHNRRHEIEIDVLKSELGDLEDQEKQGELTRSEKVQKEQLEKDIEKHRQDIQRNSKKLNKKKSRISAHKKQISQIVQQLSKFLSHYNPESPKCLPSKLNITGKTDDGSMLRSVPVLSELREVLSAKRNGRYSSYNPSLARAKWLEEKKRFLKKWGPRAAVFLLLAGGGIWATHEKIKTALAGSHLPIAEWIMDEEERLAILLKDHEEELKNNPSKLALAKQRVLTGNEDFLPKWVSSAEKIDLLASDNWSEIVHDTLAKNQYTSVGLSNIGTFKISISDYIVQKLNLVFDGNFTLLFRFAGEDRVIHSPSSTSKQPTTFNTDLVFDLEDLVNASSPPFLVFQHPIEGESGYEEYIFQTFSNRELEDKKKSASSILKNQRSVEKRQDLEKANLLKAKAELLRHPLFQVRSTRSIENWDQLEKRILELENSDDFGVILADLISKLEKDPQVIAEVEKAVRNSPHLAFTDKGYDVGPESIGKLHDGDYMTTDKAVSGMISLGMDGRFLAKMRREFGPATKAEIVLLNEDGTPSDHLKFSKPYGSHGALVMNLALNMVRRQCQVGAGAHIHIDVPFKNGKSGMQGVRYAHFKFEMSFSEMHGTNKMIGYEDALFCDELEAVRVPGFNGSPIKLLKYMDHDCDFHQKMLYAKSAQEVEEYLSDVILQIKDNPQFKKDLDEALASVQKLQFERYTYDESGNFEHKVFDGVDPLYLNSEAPKESGRYIAFGIRPALISHLEELFGEGNVDVQLSAQDKLVKEKVFCSAELGTEFKVIIRLTPNHAFSLSYPVNFKDEGASVINECRLNEDGKEAPVAVKEAQEAKELIDSVPLIGFLKFADVFRVAESANVRSLRDGFETQLKRNKKIFGKDLGDQIMNSYATTGFNNEFTHKLKERFGKDANIRLLIMGSDGMKTYKLFGAEHVNIMNVFRINHACSTATDSFVEITIPSSSGQKSTFRIQVSPSSDLKTQNNLLFCNEGQSLTKPNLHAMAEQLRLRKDELSRAKIRVLDHMGDRLADWQKFEVMVERGSVKSLRRFIQDMLPGCKKTVQMKNGRKTVHLEPHPENVEAMKAIYGKGVKVGVQFFVKGKPDGGFTVEDYQKELDVDFDKFCDFDNIVTLFIKRPKKKKFSVDTIWRPGFYNEVCPDQTYEVREPIDMYKEHFKHSHK